jgi:molybdopterin converting factor small subunit
MQVVVQLFSVLKECLPSTARRGQVTISLLENDELTLEKLIAKLGLDRRLGVSADNFAVLSAWQVLVNGHSQVDMSLHLRDGDLVQIFPPMAGG